MVQALNDSQFIFEPGTHANSFGEIEYHLMDSSKSLIAQTDRLASKSTDFCLIEVKSPAIVQFRPKADTISVALKPTLPTGVGPFICSKENLLGISAVSHLTPLWTAELPGTQLFCLSVKRSLLAKHAFDIVDTGVLESMRFLTLDAERSELLLKKLRQLKGNTDSTQALDIRLAHLLLSICEIAQCTAETSRKTAAEKLWQTLRHTPAQAISTQQLQKECGLSGNQLNHLFKRTTGLSARQFVSKYRLNCIRQVLLTRQKSFSECVAIYQYSSPDQLYKAYRQLFNDDPPLNNR